jgi:hypothetical protein
MLSGVSILLLAVTATPGSVSASADSAGPYFGQSPPQAEPLPFEVLESITALDYLGDGSFGPGGQEFCFSAANEVDYTNARIMCTRLEAGCWAAPETASFSGRSVDWGVHFSGDGRHLLFGSGRAQPPEKAWRLDIWVVERTASGWSDPTELTVNDEAESDYPAPTSRSGGLYFTSRRARDVGREIFHASPASGGYGPAEAVGPPLDSEANEWLYPSPDESHLIVSSDRPEGYGRGDLYVSFRSPEGRWQIPRNLGPTVNTPADERICFTSADGRYLFFSRDGAFFWVASSIVSTVGAHPYVKTAIADQAVVVGQAFRLGLAHHFASDRTGAVLAYSAELVDGQPLPPWLKFDPEAGGLEGTPTSPGAYRIRARAADGIRCHAANDFQLWVTDMVPPVEEAGERLPGLWCAFYEGGWDRLPDFEDLTPVGAAIAADLSLERRKGFGGLRFVSERFQDLAVVFEGLLEIDREGVYRFFVNANGGARLVIAGRTVVDHDGLHGLAETAAGAIGLKPGTHPISVQYFKRARIPGLEVSYSGPDGGRQALPASALSHVDGQGTPPAPR